MAKKLPQIKIKTFNQIQKEWHNIQQLDIRDRIKAMKTLGFDIYNSYKKDQASRNELQLYIKILQEIIHSPANTPRYRILLNKITAQWLQVTGNDKAEVISKKVGKIPVESGLIMIGDPAYMPSIQDDMDRVSEKDLLNVVNSHRAFFFGTGGDGIFNVQIRIINAYEPVVSENEYRWVFDTSQKAIVNVSSGTISVSDLLGLDSEDAISQKIENGHYKITVFSFSIPRKLDSFYIVLSKTDEVEIDNLNSIDELEHLY